MYIIHIEFILFVSVCYHILSLLHPKMTFIPFCTSTLTDVEETPKSVVPQETSASGRWGLRSFNGRTTLDAWTWRIRSLRFSKRQILSYSFTQRIKLSSTCLYAFVRAKLDLDGCNHCKLDLWMIILSHRGELFTQMVTSVLHALCLVVLWHVLLFCGAISSFVFAC